MELSLILHVENTSVSREGEVGILFVKSISSIFKSYSNNQRYSISRIGQCQQRLYIVNYKNVDCVGVSSHLLHRFTCLVSVQSYMVF